MSHADLHRTMRCRSALQTPAYIYTHNTWSFRSSPSHPRAPCPCPERIRIFAPLPLPLGSSSVLLLSSVSEGVFRRHAVRTDCIAINRRTYRHLTIRQEVIELSVKLSAVLSASRRSSDNIYPHRPSQARADAHRSHQNSISFHQLSSSRSLSCRICNNSILHWT